MPPSRRRSPPATRRRSSSTGRPAPGSRRSTRRSIAVSLAAGRPALVLVPEIALALPLVDRIRADLGADVAILHSALGEGERADAWRRIRAGAVDVVVGTRTAVLAPLADVGVVIVDEEHEATYKSDRTPRYQARDTAVRLAGLAGAAVILGSATPSVETIGLARLGRYRRVTLPERAAGTPPDGGARRPAGRAGRRQPGPRLASPGRSPGRARRRRPGDRAILVINRRGAASAVLCRDCGHVQACPECTRPLVFHQAGMTLRCHHCGAAEPMAARCPACASPRIRFLGGGTERLEAEVRSRFPGLRVGRLDRDVVERRGAAARVVDAFDEGRLDVLVGTSLVTKGLDIPEVTLVGVVSADVALTLPDERAAERTYQLLVQAIGRAGRGEHPGRAVDPDLPAGAPRHQGRRRRRRGGLLRRRAGRAGAVRCAALRRHDQADRGPGGPGRGPGCGRRDGRAAPGAVARAGRPARSSRDPRPPTCRAGAGAGGSTSSCGARIPARCSTATQVRRGPWTLTPRASSDAHRDPTRIGDPGPDAREWGPARGGHDVRRVRPPARG